MSTSPARFRRAFDKHGGRGLPFAVARRAIDGLERRANPTPTNLIDFGYSNVFPSSCDPVHAVYASGFQTAVIEFPLASIRWSRLGLRLDRDCANPFVATAAGYLGGEATEYEGSELAAYYDRWQPATAGEVLGISSTTSGAIGQQPPAASILPWEADAAHTDPGVRLERVDRWNRSEARASGQTAGLEDGHKHFGPVSSNLGRLEFKRYAALASSVRDNGFIDKVAEGYVGAQVLVAGPSAIAVVTGPGLHRAIVGAAFAAEHLVLAVEKSPALVHRDDADRWPGVRSGLFTRAAAEEVFDRMIAGRAPEGHPAEMDCE